MTRRIPISVLLGLCLSLAGCISTGTSKLADEPTMEQIKVGESTKQQVESLLGDPANRQAIEMGGASREWWAYNYSTSVVNPLDYVLLYGLWNNGIGTPDTRHDLSIFFDHRGVVTSLSRTKTDYDFGRPFSEMHLESTADKATSFQQPAQRTVRFQDKEYRY
ncbi:MAG: outer membrane protein assembly factor BamE [Nitrospiraceae bacterium]